ncbi:hypothetical protein RHODO2019_18855 (plasmid) [Rhodococcus antarcticus]|uniref:Uncharacterized protein n=1 Tax=Rhodococcus antarcticus TaxID=2987751 RepID=A0ABY6P762_9NOCA|nr:hypothetical protein [Rhodococcus antarcticus]UZJ26948.1 hypothetical protein RHODO2019_18855 [Rhodococcus antarcticus]
MSRTSRELLDLSVRSPCPRAVRHHDQYFHVQPSSVCCGTTDWTSSVTPGQIRVTWHNSLITPVS